MNEARKENDYTLNREYERAAEKFDLLARLDYYLIQELVLSWQEKGKKPKTDPSTFRPEEIRDLMSGYCDEEERILGSINRLVRKQLLLESPPPKLGKLPEAYIFSINRLADLVPKLPNFPPNLENIDTDQVKDIIDKQIEKAEIGIEWEMKKEDAFREIKKLKRQVEESERNMLRNMISIFSIFVAIFSFVVVGTNAALNIPMEGYIDVGIVLGIIFLFLFGLLYITKCLFIKK